MRKLKNFYNKAKAGYQRAMKNPLVNSLVHAGGRAIKGAIKEHAPNIYAVGKAASDIHRGKISATDGISKIMSHGKQAYANKGNAKRIIKGAAGQSLKKMKHEGGAVFNNYANSLRSSNSSAGGKMF